MSGYQAKYINSVLYMQHVDSGCTIRYEKKGKPPKEIPSYKEEYFLDWLQFTNTERRNIMKETLGNAYAPCTSTVMHSLDCCDTAVPQHIPETKRQESYGVLARRMAERAKKKEDPMYNTVNITPETVDPNQDKREYFYGRLGDIVSRKGTEAHKAFGLRDDEDPRDGEETVKRIQAGRFELVDNGHDWAGRDRKRILWRDPSIPRDRDGYDKAMETLFDTKTKATDKLWGTEPSEWLKILEDFESTTIN